MLHLVEKSISFDTDTDTHFQFLRRVSLISILTAPLLDSSPQAENTSPHESLIKQANLFHFGGWLIANIYVGILLNIS